MGSGRGLTRLGMDLYAYLVQNQCISIKDMYDVFSEYFSEEVYVSVIDDMVERGYIVANGYGHENKICLA